MSLDGLGESGSMSMDIGDGTPFRCHPHLRDSESVEMSSPGGSSGGPTPFDLHPPNHELSGSIQTPIHALPYRPLPDCERLPGSDDSPPRMVLAPSFLPATEMGDIYQDRGLARQHRAILPSLNPSVRDTEVPSRKRKHLHDLPHTTHITDHNDISHDDAFADSANAHSRRRTRPRLRRQQDGEFSPLLVMPSSPDRDSSAEEMISMSDYPPTATDSSHSIQRYFHLENPSELGPRILQSSSSPEVDDLEDPKERQRSDSASSFAQVALASTATRKLSTLSDIRIPRPFEETERPSLDTSFIKVHERGFDAPPFFPSTGGGRMSGPWASREPTGSPTGTQGHPIRPPVREHGGHAVSPRLAMPPLEPGTTKFFDKPLCDSPDSISPAEDGVTHFERPASQ